ncbi:hypothetical protein Holit_03387 [Hollandina sp. SP2]
MVLKVSFIRSYSTKVESRTLRFWFTVSTKVCSLPLTVTSFSIISLSCSTSSFMLFISPAKRSIFLMSSSMFPEIAATASLVVMACLRISPATTAKPFPAAPARAASMEALRASTLVISVILWITERFSPAALAMPCNSSVKTKDFRKPLSMTL